MWLIGILCLWLGIALFMAVIIGKAIHWATDDDPKPPKRCSF